MARLARITPLISVTDIDRSIEFYTRILGFNIGYRSDAYAFVYRDVIAIRLLSAGEAEAKGFRQRCYIDVEGVDELYESLREKLDTLPKGRIKRPFDQYYGQREFHVIDEDDLVLMFGEPVKTL